MKKLRLKLNLQFFGEGGGDGGAASGDAGVSAGEGTVNTGTAMPANMPERAKKIYEKAMQKSKGNVHTPAKAEPMENVAPEATKTPAEEEEAPATKLSFKDLLKNDEEYSKEHDRMVQKAVRDRMRKQEAESTRMKGLLDKNARKYGIDPQSATYFDDLEAAMDKDDSYYEKYAEKHDVSIETARRMVGTEEQLERMKEADRLRKETEENNRIIATLEKNAEAARATYPNLDLKTEMANPEFRRLCATLNGDVETAYFTVHRKEIMADTISKATKQAQESMVNNIKANQGRPSENGLSSTNPTNVASSWKGKSLEDIRAYANEQRRKLQGR